MKRMTDNTVWFSLQAVQQLLSNPTASPGSMININVLWRKQWGNAISTRMIWSDLLQSCVDGHQPTLWWDEVGLKLPDTCKQTLPVTVTVNSSAHKQHLNIVDRTKTCIPMNFALNFTWIDVNGISLLALCAGECRQAKDKHDVI